MSQTTRSALRELKHTLSIEIEYCEIGDLEPGEHFTLGKRCPLTFLVRSKHRGRAGRTEVDTTVLVGLSAGRSYAKTFIRSDLEVMLIPDQFVGDRLSRAIEEFSRERQGEDRIELGSDVFPYATPIGAAHRHLEAGAKDAEVSA